MYAIYDKQSESENVQLNIYGETEELMELTDAEEISRQLKQDHRSEYDRISKLPNGIRSAKDSTKSGTYVFYGASDPNRPDIRSHYKSFKHSCKLFLSKLSWALISSFKRRSHIAIDNLQLLHL